MSEFAPVQREGDRLSPFISRTSQVTPYGLVVVTLTSRLDMPGCKIQTLEPVSIIRLLGIPSISIRTVGVPCSNTIETKDFMALSWGLRWKELPSFSPLIVPQIFLFPSDFPTFCLG